MTYCSNEQPWALMDEEQKIVDCNKRLSEMAGFKSIYQAKGKKYSEQNCPASQYSDDFIFQDKLVWQNKSALNFISLYRYTSGIHCLLGTKTLKRQKNKNYLQANYFDLTQKIPPVLLEILIHSITGKSPSNTEAFWHSLDSPTTEKLLFSPREQQCLYYLSRGYTNKMIAAKFNRSTRTIEENIENLKIKLNAHTRWEIIEKFLQKGFTESLIQISD